MSVLVGQRAPEFTASAVINGKDIVNDFSLAQYLGKRYVLLFFYPADFTPVCPTELIALQGILPELEKRDVALVAVSGDSQFVHKRWLATPINDGGIAGVTYPLVADGSKTIIQNYGVLAGDFMYGEGGEMAFEGAPMAFRASFLIDKKGIVRHQVVNDLPLSRSTDETVRMVDALIHNEQYGEACPVNWKKGDQGI